MKTYFILLLVLLGHTVVGQEINGGAIEPPIQTKCLTETQRTEIQAQLEKNVSELVQAGKLPKYSQKSNMITLFDWPLQASNDLFYDSYFGVSNYVDQDNTTGIEDYNCSNRTYNGHFGTDYYTYPFPWFMIENDLVEVVAAADGVIISKSDGNDDDHCSPSGFWNAVYLQHADGSRSWYGHLKKNSLTSKNIGQSVVAGEYLGIVASSGNSTGPHLHFEVYDGNNNLIDPYSGNCNGLNNDSWWNNQPDYTDSKINALLTHYDAPLQGCPDTNENPRMRNTFYSGEIIYTAAYYIDQQENDLTLFRISRPDHSIYTDWVHSSPSTYYSSWWYWYRYLPVNGPYGVWSFEAEYNGTVYTHEFRYLNSNCLTQETNTWIGPSTGIWNYNKNNWSLGFVPSACDIVVIPSGNQVSLVDGEEYYCYKLEIGAGAELIINPNNTMHVSVEP